MPEFSGSSMPEFSGSSMPEFSGLIFRSSPSVINPSLRHHETESPSRPANPLDRSLAGLLITDTGGFRFCFAEMKNPLCAEIVSEATLVFQMESGRYRAALSCRGIACLSVLTETDRATPLKTGVCGSFMNIER